MTPGQLDAARALVAEGAVSMGEVARQVGVGRTTLYRHLGPRGRDPQALTLAEAAAELGLGVPAVRELVRRGQLPVSTGAHASLVQRCDLDVFIEGCRIEPGALQHLIT